MQTIVFQLLVQVILILINAFFAATQHDVPCFKLDWHWISAMVRARYRYSERLRRTIARGF